MANLLKTNPVGLDAIIHDTQVEVYKLATEWGIELTGYPRCYILEKDGKKTIESYLQDNDYSNSLIFAEENKFFFVVPNDIEKASTNYYTTTIELYFMLNLKECKPSITHRADEEVRVDVINRLRNVPLVNVTNVIINSDKVFNRYNSRISLNYEYEYTDDMQPYHYFKLEMEVLPYNINQTSCN